MRLKQLTAQQVTHTVAYVYLRITVDLVI